MTVESIPKHTPKVCSSESGACAVAWGSARGSARLILIQDSTQLSTLEEELPGPVGPQSYIAGT
jgi:hypothetical protein